MRLGNRAESGTSRADAIASDLFFYLLLALNLVRTLRHAMWRDELQIFQTAARSRTLADLLHNLRYETHGLLWDAMVWGVLQFTTNPVWMQVLHAVIATALWILIYRWSPFTRLEKFLLLLSHFLFFEYFVVSRAYGLAVLCGLGFVAVRHRPEHALLAWLLLGLQANLAAHATIWSIAFAFVFLLEERRHDVPFLGGAALYLGLLIFGIVHMVPPADFGPWSAHPGFDIRSLGNAPVVMLGAFIPLDAGSLRAAAAFLAEPYGTAVPFVWNPNPIGQVLALTGADTALSWRVMALLLVPVVLCALLTRNFYRTLEFSLAYVGILLFAVLWQFTGNARHHGLIFAALVGCVWAARMRMPRATSSWLLTGLLAVNALGGVLSLGSEFSTFSNGRNAAHWIESNGLAAEPLIGSRDAQISTVAGYLGRPIYYLECECPGTSIIWNARRQSPLSTEQVRERLVRALERTQSQDAVLIRNRPLGSEELPEGAAHALLQSFTGAVTDENYWIYRLTGAKR